MVLPRDTVVPEPIDDDPTDFDPRFDDEYDEYIDEVTATIRSCGCFFCKGACSVWNNRLWQIIFPPEVGFTVLDAGRVFGFIQACKWTLVSVFGGFIGLVVGPSIPIYDSSSYGSIFAVVLRCLCYTVMAIAIRKSMTFGGQTEAREICIRYLPRHIYARNAE
jgi:hypothetical protein